MSHNHNHNHCACQEGHCANEHDHNHDEESMSWWKPAISLVMLSVGIMMTALDAQWFQNDWVRAAWYAIAWLPTGVGVLREAIESTKEGEIFNEFLLMSVASIGAFALGEYPEAVAVMALYCIGEALQDRAVNHARSNIEALIAFRPDHATIINGETKHVVSPAEVRIGEIVEVKAGERVPVDGTLDSGTAAFDTAALTGESQPRLIENGGEVLAGMIAIESTIRINVTRPASESAVSRILHLVDEASERKAPTEQFIRRFARIYTPIVVGLAVLVVVLPWIYSSLIPGTPGYAFSQWLHRALIFLVISCPCALVISVPLSYFAGIGAASRRGILFKGSNYLDAMSRVETVALDKTGTLTTGRFTVSHVTLLTDEQVAIVATIEQESPHPIARAIIEYQAPASIAIEEVKNIAGYGLVAQVAGEVWLVGNSRLLEQEHVPFPATLLHETQTVVVVAVGGKYAGHILLNDEPKGDASQAIGALNGMGISTVMLSGDKQALVNGVAHQLGIPQAHGDLLPQDKVAHIERLKQQSNGLVAFVGDGINDAPVLAMSDVGIAMGALGSDMAIETADVVIQTDQPSRVSEAITLSRRTRRIVTENIAFAIAVKVIVMILGLMGIATMWEAVFADVGVALLCVLNALRVKGNPNQVSQLSRHQQRRQ